MKRILAALLLVAAPAFAESPRMVEAGSYTVTYDASNRCLSARSIAELPANILCQDHALLWREDTQSWYESINFVWTPIDFGGGGDLEFPLLAPDGSEAIPQYSFENSPTTGIFSSGADVFNITAAGTSRFALSSASLTSTVPFLAPNGSQAAPGFAFSGSPSAGLWANSTTHHLLSGAQASGANQAGGRMDIRTGRGTGTGAGGQLNLYVTLPRATSDSTAHTEQQLVTINGTTGSSTFGNLTLFAGAAGSTNLVGVEQSGTTDTAGGNIQIDAGEGTGSAAASSILFRTPTVGASGTTTQTLATRMTVATEGITGTVPFLAPDGAVTAPSHTFTNATSAGAYIGASNTVSFKGEDGSGADSAGSTVAVLGGAGTGSAAGGEVHLFVAPPSTTGSSLNTYQAAFAANSTGTVQVGGIDVLGVPGDSFIVGGDRAAGVTDGAAGAMTVRAGRGTGSGQGGNFFMQVAPPGASGTSQNTAQTFFSVTASSGAVVLGGLDYLSGPGTMTLAGTDITAGVTNTTGGDTDIRSGLGTGNAAATSINLRTPTLEASGTTQQSAATRMTVSTTAITDTVPYINSTTTSIGWSVVAGADTACNTTCTNACVFGWNLTAANITGTLLACTDATADACLCAGAN